MTNYVAYTLITTSPSLSQVRSFNYRFCRKIKLRLKRRPKGLGIMLNQKVKRNKMQLFSAHSKHKVIVTSSRDATFRVCDFRVPTRQTVIVGQGHSQTVTAAVFAEDDKVRIIISFVLFAIGNVV